MLSLNTSAQAQHFTFSYKHGAYQPGLAYFNPDNLFSENMSFKIPFTRISDSLSNLTLKPITPGFGQLGASDILINPMDSLFGELTNRAQFIYIGDTANANYIIYKLQLDFSNFRRNYRRDDPPEAFISLFNNSKFYIKKLSKFLDSAQNLKFNIHTISAIKEYSMILLANFSVFPILLNSEFDHNEIKKRIKETIRIVIPEYWMQTQAGHIFLHTYYSKVVLPTVNYDFELALKDSFFSTLKIKKYVAAYFFEEYAKNALAFNMNPTKVMKSYNQYLSMFKFTPDEMRTLAELKTKISRIGKNVLADIVMQEMEDLNGRKLSLIEKNKIFSNGNIMLDVWASWCIPCREKMDKLISGKAKIHKKDFEIIFLSLDKKPKEWTSVKYPYLNSSNSFRIIINRNNPFIDNFNIGAIPHYILISNSMLISDKYESL